MFYNSKYPIEYTIGVRELVAMGCVLVDRTTGMSVQYLYITWKWRLNKSPPFGITSQISGKESRRQKVT